MALDMEREDSTGAKSSEQFRLLTPWMCAGLVAGVEVWQKSQVVAIFVLACAVAMLFAILAGIDMWRSPSGQSTIREDIRLREAVQARPEVTPASLSD